VPPVFSLEASAGADGRTTVSVSGELDLANAAAFGAAVGDALATGPVLVDLNELSFMDSAGVRALNVALQQAAASGQEMRVGRKMQPNVAQVLELTGMMSLLRIEEDGA
jgi:anti-anti-sigma factor